MNKILLTLASLTAGLSALAQGQVNLNNNFIATGASAKAFVLGVDGLAEPKAFGHAQFLDSLGNLLPVAPSGTNPQPADGTGKAFASDGLFFIGVLAVPNIPIGGNGSIILQAWDGPAGSTYATAVARASSIITVTGLGGGAIPPPGLGSPIDPNNPALGLHSNFTGLELVPTSAIPEPSTFALAAFGLAGLFFVARRK
jgi:hypothetical protein